MLTAVATMLVFGAITFVLWIGAHDVLAGEMTGGQLGQFLLYAVLRRHRRGLADRDVGRGAARRRCDGAAGRAAARRAGDPSRPPMPVAAAEPGAAQIRFENVSFRYPSRPGHAGARRTSRSTSRPGETVAFVGPSGAGKSTTFQLLLRFYDPQSGRILHRRRRHRAAPIPQAVRRRIGLVPQDTVLFGAARARTSATAGPARPMPRSRRRRGPPRPTSSSAQAARGLRHLPRRARHAAVGRPAAAHRHRARDPARTRRSCCSTRPRARSTPRASGWCRRRSSA